MELGFQQALPWANSEKERAGFRLCLPQSLSRARENFRLVGIPLLTGLPWLPIAFQLKTRPSKAFKAL